MRRGSTGQYEITRSAGEQVRAFVPQPLPPDPAVNLSNARQRLLERATLALGRLDSITLLLPDPNIFLYAYVRREAVLSSRLGKLALKRQANEYKYSDSEVSDVTLSWCTLMGCCVAEVVSRHFLSGRGL